jgi:hypothetical protein
MGNRLPFFKRRRNEDEPSDQPVEKEASVSPRIAAAGPIAREPHTHRLLDQDQVHVHSPPAATTSRPVNVSSAAEPKEIPDQPDETKTLEGAEQSQVLHVETDVPGPVSATAHGSREGQRPKTLETVSSEDGSRTGHSTSTGEDGSSGTGKTGHSTRTKRKHKTVTRKRQHGELRLVCGNLFLIWGSTLTLNSGTMSNCIFSFMRKTAHAPLNYTLNYHFHAS